MAEVTPVTEEGLRNGGSFHQMFTEFQLKANGRSSSGRVNSAENALGQEIFPTNLS